MDFVQYLTNRISNLCLLFLNCDFVGILNTIGKGSFVIVKLKKIGGRLFFIKELLTEYEDDSTLQ